MAASFAVRLLVRTLRTALGVAVYASLAFLGAGRLDWPRGWIYAGVFATVTLAGSLIVQTANPGLLEARAKGLRQDTKEFDRTFYRLFLPLVLFYPLLAGVDAARFGWTELPSVAVPVGVALFLAGSALTAWTMLANPYAEATVRIQTERGHAVVTAGPYRFVRHPMYAGTLLGLPSGALILGSAWALAPMGLIAGLFVWRTAREDRALQAELPGYAAYAAVTPYRLLPGVW